MMMPFPRREEGGSLTLVRESVLRGDVDVVQSDGGGRRIG
jgi:RNase P/RNase MRP subunit p30